MFRLIEIIYGQYFILFIFSAVPIRDPRYLHFLHYVDQFFVTLYSFFSVFADRFRCLSRAAIAFLMFSAHLRLLVTQLMSSAYCWLMLTKAEVLCMNGLDGVMVVCFNIKIIINHLNVLVSSLFFNIEWNSDSLNDKARRRNYEYGTSVCPPKVAKVHCGSNVKL